MDKALDFINYTKSKVTLRNNVEYDDAEARLVLENSLNIQYSNQDLRYDSYATDTTMLVIPKTDDGKVTSEDLATAYTKTVKGTSCRIADLNSFTGDQTKLKYFDIYHTGTDDEGNMTIGVIDVIGLSPVDVNSLKTAFVEGEDYHPYQGDCNLQGGKRAIHDMSTVLNNLALIDNYNSSQQFGFINIETVSTGGRQVIPITVYTLETGVAGWYHICGPGPEKPDCSTIDVPELYCVTHEEMNVHVAEYRLGISDQGVDLGGKTNFHNRIYYDDWFNNVFSDIDNFITWSGFYSFGDLVSYDVFMNEALMECP